MTFESFRPMAAMFALAVFGTIAYAQTPTITPTPDLPPAAAASYVRPDKGERAHRYWKNMFSYTSLAKNVAGAGISTYTESPKEWGQHWSGFGKRVASNIGKSVIGNTTIYGLEEALKYDSRYVPATGKSFAYRFTNAAISPLMARNEHGRRVFGIPRVTAAFTTTLIAEKAWYPDRHSWQDGMRSGVISLGTTALFNLIKEFAHHR